MDKLCDLIGHIRLNGKREKDERSNQVEGENTEGIHEGRSIGDCLGSIFVSLRFKVFLEFFFSSYPGQF